MLNTLQVSFREGMKRTILRLEQQGKVVLIPRNPCACRSICQCHHHRLLPRIEMLVGLRNGVPNLLYRLATRVARQIRAKESTLAVHRVTLRAPRFSREKSFASLRIAPAGEGKCRGPATAANAGPQPRFWCRQGYGRTASQRLQSLSERFPRGPHPTSVEARRGRQCPARAHCLAHPTRDKLRISWQKSAGPPACSAVALP